MARRHDPIRENYLAHLGELPGKQPAGAPLLHAGDGKAEDHKGPGGLHSKNKTAQRYLEEAQTLAGQAKALRAALGKKGFKSALKGQLANVKLGMHETDAELLRGFNDRVGSLEAVAADNEKASSSQTVANANNAARERANVLSEAMANGAGESDALRAQQMSLNNWQANQSEVNRNYFDTATSINSSLTDLETDTRSARVQNFIQAEADKNQLWSNYYDQRSETLTQLGNVQGQRAEYLGLANEARGGKKIRRRRKKAQDASEEAFMDAADEAGRSHESRDVPGRLTDWQGREPFRAAAPRTTFLDTGPLAAPEGATLRKFP